jgi:hypothetical protein
MRTARRSDPVLHCVGYCLSAGKRLARANGAFKFEYNLVQDLIVSASCAFSSRDITVLTLFANLVLAGVRSV